MEEGFNVTGFLIIAGVALAIVLIFLVPKLWLKDEGPLFDASFSIIRTEIDNVPSLLFRFTGKGTEDGYPFSIDGEKLKIILYYSNETSKEVVFENKIGPFDELVLPVGGDMQFYEIYYDEKLIK